MRRGIYSPLFTEEEELDEFINENTEEEDIQPLEPLTVSYQNKQDEETVNSSILTTEPDEQLDRARYFPEQDEHWKYDDRRTEEENQWGINSGTDQESFDPTDIFSSPYCPTTSRTRMNETFLNQKSDYQTIETKEERDTENIRQSRGSDLFAEQEGCTPWIAKTEYEGLLKPEDQLQLSPMKPDGITERPTPTTTTKEVKFFLKLGNFDEEFPQNEEDLTKSKDKQNEKGRDYNDTIISTEDLFLDLLDQELDDERTFENDDEQFDPIKTLSVHEPRTLHNHFSKVAAATSVNDVIAVNNMNKDPQKRITLGRDMDITVENKINVSLGKRPNMWKDESENWPIRLLRSPNKKGSSILMPDPLMPKPLDKTKQTNDLIAWMIKSPDAITVTAKYGNSWCSRIVKGQSDGRQARQNLSLSGPKENFVCILGWRLEDLTKPMNGTSIPWNPHERNLFNTFTEDVLLPGNLRTSWKREGNLLFYITAFSLGIRPRPLFMDPSESFNSELVMEDHESTKGVILRISQPYNNGTDGTTTISHGTRDKQYELPDGSILDRKTHFVLHKSEQLLASKLITNTMHHPWKNGTIERIYSRLSLATLGYYPKIETSTETRKISLTSSYSTSPITHHHNMFLRKTKSTPILKTPSTFEDENERLNRNINHLQNMIDDMIKEYEYMDRPLKCPHKPESSPITSLTDKSIFLNQRND
jgi:hypothetical protein